MRSDLGAMRLGGGQRLVEIIARQAYLDAVAAKGARLFDLLLRCGHGHENLAHHAEMAADIGKALRVIARAGADKAVHFGLGRAQFAHGVQGTSDLVGAHGGEVFALEIYVGVELVGQVIIALQRRRLEDYAHQCGGVTGRCFELGHHGDCLACCQRHVD